MTLVIFALGIGLLLILIAAIITIISDPARVDEEEKLEVKRNWSFRHYS